MTEAANTTTRSTGTLSLDYLNSPFLDYAGLSAQYAVGSQMQLVALNSESGIGQLAAASSLTASGVYRCSVRSLAWHCCGRGWLEVG
jgi:hypothetical protein